MRRLMALIGAVSSVVVAMGVFEASGRQATPGAEWTPDAGT